jgi:alpha-methylacyl-CoA racemase
VPAVSPDHIRDLLTNLLISTDTDACVVPVLTPAEAGEMEDMFPRPHPRLGRTGRENVQMDALELRAGEHSLEVLEEMGVSLEEGRRLVREWTAQSKL